MPATIAVTPKKLPVIATTTKETFPVLEMTCASCAVSVESMLKSVEGVKDAGVNFPNQSAWVEYEPTVVTKTDLQNTVRSIGYDLVIDSENSDTIKEESIKNRYQETRQRTIWSSVLSLPIVIIGMFFMNLPYGNWIMMVLATPVVFYFGKNFFINAWKQAKHGKANMDTLVALSTGVAYFFSAFNTIYPAFWHQRGVHPHVYFEAAAVIIVFISLGKMLEEKASSSTSSALKKLMSLQPATVTVMLEGGRTEERPTAKVAVGDIILVKPGEKIPVDGIVTIGESYVDESMISGEPIPVIKNTGEKVFAGTINQKGSFQFEAAKVGGDTVLAQIIKMVREAQGSKAPVQKLVDKIAGIFVPVVIGISLLTFTVWMVLGGDNAFTHALMNAVTVLVIACPCALGLATPTAIMVGVGKGAENNILIRDAESLELAHRVNAVVLDKTGTITEGRPQVTDLIFLNDERKVLLSGILRSIESQSEHPLAEAVVKYFEKEKPLPVELTGVKSFTGMGIVAYHQQVRYSIGNLALLNELDIVPDQELIEKVEGMQNEAKTVVVFSEGLLPVAIIGIADKVKPTSREAILSMRESGIEVYMLTGDNSHTAAAVAAQAGIDQYRADVMPSDKAGFISELQRQGKIVAMVGDGINDSQALAQADVSIAMGRGSDIAMDVAKMTLITSDLNSIPKALRLSRKTVRTIRQNLFWAFIYNLAGIPIAAGLLYPINGFLLNPMIAGAAMAFSSVSVVSNSLRLKLTRL